jgi:transposase
MRLKTILNGIEKHTGFVYTEARWAKAWGKKVIEVGIRPRSNGRAICSVCEKPAPGYDRLGERRFEYVPLWGIAVFLVYTMRRVECRRCGVRVEKVPWASGKHQLTSSYLWFLARWAKRLSWSEVARIFGTSWASVFRAVEGAVEWGRAHAAYDAITAIGVDEVQWRRGHKYLTVVYEIGGECRRLLWVGEHREEETLRGFFTWLGAKRAAKIRFACSDMWKPYLNVIREQIPRAIHVLDRFHIVQTMNKAIDEVRAKEARKLKEAGAEPVLTHSRWCLLKRPRNLTEKQESRLQDLLGYNLRTVRAYLLKEDFQFLWGYASAGWAGRFLDAWCTRAMRSRIEPMKKIARSLRAHRPLILNWFRARQLIALGAVEGFNNKLKLTTRRSYGFRVFRVIEIALYHALGNLPEPKGTHRFC